MEPSRNAGSQSSGFYLIALSNLVHQTHALEELGLGFIRLNKVLRVVA